MDTVNINLTPEAGTALLKCVGRAMQTCELEMQRYNGQRREGARQEWLALDDVLSQIQEAKHEFYGDES